MVTHQSFIVDAFTQELYKGNQAAVCLISKVLANNEYQKIGAEFNLSETAFPVPLDGDYKTASKFSLRWFTPTVEVALCGHATLATSHVLFYETGNVNEKITFSTKSGELIVMKAPNNFVAMDFPQYDVTSISLSAKHVKAQSEFSKIDGPHILSDIIDCIVPSSLLVESIAYAPEAKKLIIVLDSTITRAQLEGLTPDTKRMVSLHPNGDFVRGVMVTVKPKNAQEQGFVDKEGKIYDYSSRYFAPWVGITEDPATGSAQCCLAPYWGRLLNKTEVYALQCYPRRGAEFVVQIREKKRVILTGMSKTFLEGRIRL